jgi:NADP-dependent aldehyde dehydrogenase
MTDPDLLGTSLIGSIRSSGGGKEFAATNPVTRAALPPAYVSATPDDVAQAATLAAVAFRTYGSLTGKVKGAFLHAIAANLESAGEQIVQRAHLETALAIPRLQGELARTCNQLRMFAGLVEEGSWVDARIDTGNPGRTPLPRPDVRSLLRPVGPVAVFGASNFPLAFSVAGGDTAAALAAGCPVVVKAHPAHPGTSELTAIVLQQTVRECGLPEGTCSVLFDNDFEAGLALVKHSMISAVGFTGSRRAGHALVDAASKRAVPIPVFAEMSSINPLVILPGAIRDRSTTIAESLHASVILGVGQFCTNPGLIFVLAGKETEKFISGLGRLFAGTPKGTMLSKRIATLYCERVSQLEGAPGVTTVAGGAAGAQGYEAPASLFRTGGSTFISNGMLSEEVFGPATLVVVCEDKEELVSVARILEGQLTASVHGTEADLLENRTLLDVLETKAGRIVFNGYPTGVEVGHAMVHGGPYPATSDGRSTSVGSRAIMRFVRQVCFQNSPEALLPDELKTSNPLGIQRMVDGILTREH